MNNYIATDTDIADPQHRQAVTFHIRERRRPTRRQKKHDMLLTFMTHANTGNPRRRPALMNPSLLHSLKAFFA